MIVTKTSVTSTRGIVAAKHPLAAQAGVAVLREGGNAVDAIVTAAFVSGVTEPHMSGLGGGGYLVLHDQATGRSIAIDYSIQAPHQAHAAMYQLEEGQDLEAFGWRRVHNRANAIGPLSIGIPGTLAGLAVALQQFGTISLERALAPAITIAEHGVPIDWYLAQYRGYYANVLLADPLTTATYLKSDRFSTTGERLLVQPLLARTLKRIRHEGPAALYSGSLGLQLVASVKAQGGILTFEDLANYEVTIQEPAVLGQYRNLDIIGRRAGTGGVSLMQLLNILDHFDLRALGHGSADALHIYLQAAQHVRADRLAFLADPAMQQVPLKGLLSRSYAAACAREITERETTSSLGAGNPWNYQEAPIAPADVHSSPSEAGGSTTALAAIDSNGLAVSITQTLMSAWGSGVVAGDTGILLNNGMLWFNPEPGTVNSVQGGQRGLNNMCPVVLRQRASAGPRTVLATGASGGRQIMHAVAQVILGVVDFDLDPQQAIVAPRVDVSMSTPTVDPRFGDAVLSELRRRGHRLTVLPDGFLPRHYASPIALTRRGEYMYGGVDVYHPALAIGL